jgi:hypothetical protein
MCSFFMTHPVDLANIHTKIVSTHPASFHLMLSIPLTRVERLYRKNHKLTYRIEKYRTDSRVSGKTGINTEFSNRIFGIPNVNNLNIFHYFQQLTLC